MKRVATAIGSIFLSLLFAVTLCAFLMGCHCRQNEMEELNDIEIGNKLFSKNEIKDFIGLSANDIAGKLGPPGDNIDISFIHEPPCHLRGFYLSLGNGLVVQLVIDHRDLYFKDFDGRLNWDWNVVGKAIISGIQCETKQGRLHVGAPCFP